MQQQPDFNAVFHEAFADLSEPLRYSIRQQPILHDLAIMGTLLHDSIIKPNEIIRHGRAVSIPVDRDAWEVYITQEECGELPAVDARLQIRGVIRMEWLPSTPGGEFMVNYPWIGEDWRMHEPDEFTFSLVAEDARLQFGLDKFDWSIELEDLEMPRFYG